MKNKLLFYSPKFKISIQLIWDLKFIGFGLFITSYFVEHWKEYKLGFTFGPLHIAVFKLCTIKSKHLPTIEEIRERYNTPVESTCGNEVVDANEDLAIKVMQDSTI